MGRINGSVSQRSDSYSFYIDWSESKASDYISTNKTTVNATAYIYCSAHTAWASGLSQKLIIDGTEFTATKTVDLSPGVRVALVSGSKTITHNSDGKKSVTISASCDLPDGGGWGPAWGSASGTATLTTIPRASSITAVDANIESATTININRASSGFSHTITYSFSGLTGTIATKNWNTSMGWTIPSSFYAKIPNSKTGTVTLTCITYSGDTEIGRKTTTFTVTASETMCKPTITAELIDSNSTTVALTGDNTKLIKYKSTAKITPTATAKNSATISNIKVNGITVSGSYIEIQNVQSETFTVTVTDSRGYTNSATLSPEIIQYISLTSTAKFDRVSATSSEVTVEYGGNYFNNDFSTNESNQLTVTWAYKEKDAATWITGGTLNPTFNGNTYSGQATLGNTFNYQKAYDFILYISDRLSEANYQDIVKRGESYYDYGVDANGNNYFWINGDLYIKEDNKVLWSGNESPNGKTYTLSDNIYNYRFAKVVAQWGNNFVIPIIKNNTYFNGGTNFPLGNGTGMSTSGITATIQDGGNKLNVLYFRQLTHTQNGNHGVFETPKLQAIIGIK